MKINASVKFDHYESERSTSLDCYLTLLIMKQFLMVKARVLPRNDCRSIRILT